jgi:hypothetical protein
MGFLLVWVWPQNPTAAISVETGGGMWHDHEGCIKAKQLHVKGLAVR